MIPAVAVGAIHRMAYATTEDEAQALIAEAIRRGADPDDALDAFTLWKQMRAHDVQQVGGVRCLCGHGQSNHTRGELQCWHAACGCSSYREKS